MIIPFLVPVGCITRTIMFYYLSQTDIKTPQYPIIYATITSFCQILGGSAEFISIIRSKNTKKNESQSIKIRGKEINPVHYVANHKKLSIWLFILLVGLLYWGFHALLQCTSR